MGDDAHRLRAPALRAEHRRARARADGRARRLPDRRVPGPPPRARRSATRSSRSRARATSTPSSPSGWASRPARTSARLQRGETVDGVAPEQVMGPDATGRKVVLSGDTAPCEALRSPRTRPTCSCTRRRSPRRRPSARARPPTARPARPPRSRARPRSRLLALTHISSRYAGGRAARRGARGLRRDRGARATSTRSRCRSPSAASRSSCAGPSARRASGQARARPAESRRARPRPARARRRPRRSPPLIHSPRSFNPVP